LFWLHRGPYRRLLARPFAWLPVAIGVVGILALYFALAFESGIDSFLGMFQYVRYTDQVELLFVIYVLTLVWRYRKTASHLLDLRAGRVGLSADPDLPGLALSADSLVYSLRVLLATRCGADLAGCRQTIGRNRLAESCH